MNDGQKASILGRPVVLNGASSSGNAMAAAPARLLMGERARTGLDDLVRRILPFGPAPYASPSRAIP